MPDPSPLRRYVPVIAAVIGLGTSVAQAQTWIAESPDAVFWAATAAVGGPTSGEGAVYIADRSAETRAIAMERACQGRLSTHLFSVNNGDYRTVSVRCPQPSWVLYLEVRSRKMVQVAVATRHLASGASITPRDFKVTVMPADDLTGQRIPGPRLPGMRTAVPLSPGTPIVRGDVTMPMVVQSGKVYQAVYSAGGIAVYFDCRAMQNGAIGDTILVANVRTGHRVEALIVRSKAPAPTGRTYIVAVN